MLRVKKPGVEKSKIPRAKVLTGGAQSVHDRAQLKQMGTPLQLANISHERGT